VRRGSADSQVHRLIALAGVVAAVAFAAAVGGPAAAQQPQPPGAPPPVELSHPREVTRWAYATRPALVRQDPLPGALEVARLRLRTEGGAPEVYLLLSQHRERNGITWVHVRIPDRPNGRHGWVPRDALGPYRAVRTFLLVNRKTLRLTLYKSGQRIFQAPIGVGKRGTPTPAGRFWIRTKLKVEGKTLYGPRAIGTSAYAPYLTDWPQGGVIGLHGTNRPNLVPGRPSHGCIRLRNWDIRRLYPLIPRGTPVQIV
jgi:L,D-transpeptidase-like protein